MHLSSFTVMLLLPHGDDLLEFVLDVFQEFAQSLPDKLTGIFFKIPEMS